MTNPLHLLKACEVCERGASVAALRNVTFKNGSLFAYNGIYQYQAPFDLKTDESFAVNEAKVAAAIRSCGDEVEVSITKEFLRIKNGPFSVRVRKIETVSPLELITLPPKTPKTAPEGLLEALRRVRPFVSTDASRPWSVAVRVAEGFAWATNNLSLVRAPIACKIPDMIIPAAAVDFVCELGSIDRLGIESTGHIVIQCGDALVRFSQALAQWPDMGNFFKKMPAKLPEIPSEMTEAAAKVAKFAERFISIDDSKLHSKSESVETEYEVSFKKSKGIYNASMLALILENATHADFSFYPDPIYFRGEGIEGTAVGVKEPT